ncbi:MAG: protein-L-isoaspartate O-methyltransferase family protein [Acidimicrobiales bacterium]
MGHDSAELRERLVGQLWADGSIVSAALADAFRTVPRERFLSEVAEREGLEAVYRNEPIVTRRDGRGMPVSSSSQPTVMALMLECLAVAPGQRVLEVGAGTGYNAALLTTLAGAGGHVTSVELDPELAAQAGDALRRGGHRVDVVQGDGRRGWLAGAPYDRIIVTASSPDVPPAWFDQLVPGGLVELPLHLRAGMQRVVTLRKVGAGLESVATVPGAFMALRAGAHDPSPVAEALQASAGRGPPLVWMAGLGVDGLRPAARRRLLALALDDSRVVPLGLRAPAEALRLYVNLAAPEAGLVDGMAHGRYRRRAGQWGGGTLGVVDGDGRGLALLGSGPVVTRLDAWGDPGPAELLVGLVEEWRPHGRPAEHRLQVRVGYGRAPAAWRSLRRSGCVVSFDWPPTIASHGR